MRLRDRAQIWRQQKYNNSCAWDCFSMLLAARGVKTTAREIVGSSHVPYQLRLHPKDHRLSAGMLVQSDSSVGLALERFGFRLGSRRAATIPEYIALAKKTLGNTDAFVTNLKRPDSLPGRHAVVMTELQDSRFMGLDPDCRLDRSKNYNYSDVEETVALNFREEDLVQAASGEKGFVPLIGVLSPSTPQEPVFPSLQDVFRISNDALKFYSSQTKDLDFKNGDSLDAVYSMIKPIVLDLRTAIEIRDEFLNHKSKTASFLNEFEREILSFRELVRGGRVVPDKTANRLSILLKESYIILEEHFSFSAFLKGGHYARQN